MMGGGAEKIITLLANSFYLHGCEVIIILSNQKNNDVVGYKTEDGIKVLSLPEMSDRNKTSIFDLSNRFIWNIIYRLSKKTRKKVTDLVAIQHFKYENIIRVKQLKKVFEQYPNSCVISFLQYSHQLCILSLGNSNHQLILSERGDPKQHENETTSSAFIRNMYERVSAFVFQTTSAMQWYPENIQKRGVIIPNPIPLNLPDKYIGERRKVVVNFCRISREKNLGLLIDAFYRFYKRFSEYSLHIYGDASTESGKIVKDELEKKLIEYGLEHAVYFFPFTPNIHEIIKDCGMFVSSSDFEGMSNSMLEAMAIGLPSICTDCPSGGARDVIRDHENGLLVPINNAEALCEAMCEVAEDASLSEMLSKNGTKIRKRLSIDRILNEWWKVINS